MNIELTRYSLLQKDRPIDLLWTIYGKTGVSYQPPPSWEKYLPSVNRNIPFISGCIEFVCISSRHSMEEELNKANEKQSPAFIYQICEEILSWNLAMLPRHETSCVVSGHFPSILPPCQGISSMKISWSSFFGRGWSKSLTVLREPLN